VATNIWPSDLLDGGADRLGGERNWWLVYTRSRQEKAVAERILPQGVPFYLPLIQRSSLTRGRKRVAQVPLFVGYLFLFGTPQEREQTLKTNRVSTIHVVKDADGLQRDLARIADLISRNAPLTPEARLEPGEYVRVKGGPLVGLEGTIIRRKGKSRLLVAVNYLKQGASVEIDDFLVESA
jgi:transcriptional antiterminator RfaH